MTLPPPRPNRRPWLRWSLRAAIALSALALGFESFRIYGGLNDHAVVPGHIYRTAQPSGAQFDELVRKHGIRTVLNLRGQAPWDDWYRGESEATERNGLDQQDVTLSAHALPFPSELKRAIEVMDRAEWPILIHCKQGADRTGLLSAISLLLYTDATVGEARRQLWPRYGHWPVVRTQNMDRFFDLYEAYLAESNATHDSKRLRSWIETSYEKLTPRSELRWIDPPPSELKANEPTAYRVAAINRSEVAWPLSPGTFAGVHWSFTVYDETMESVAGGRAGLRTGSIGPGEAYEATIPLGGLKPGRYWLAVELHDATHAAVPFRTQSFAKYGDDSLVAEFTVGY